MKDKENFNIDAMLGGDLDDMDIVRQYGLNPDVAYKPEINEAMITAIFESNGRDGIRSGRTLEESTRIAREQRAIAVERIASVRKARQL